MAEEELVAIPVPLKLWLSASMFFTIVFLAICAVVAARAGGSGIIRAMMRICFWGTVAMVVTAIVGYLFGVAQ